MRTCFVVAITSLSISSARANLYFVGHAGVDFGGPRLRFRSEAQLLFGGCGNLDPDSDCFFDLGLGVKLSAVYPW